MSIGDARASDDFMEAFAKGIIQTLLAKVQLERGELLSYYDVKELVRPAGETYLGTRPIPVERIIGSEGRYSDFSSAFLPKKALLKGRWMNVSRAYARMVDLPAISVFKLGSAYFVRDGNHRVSVAKSLGVEFIDAEIVELDAEIELEAGMTNRQIKRRVLEYEREKVIEATAIDRLIDFRNIRFTEPGRYTEMLHHIDIHRKFIRITEGREMDFNAGAVSWYLNVYLPIAEAIVSQRIQNRFPGRTTADLYIWIVKHWNRLKGRHGFGVKPDEASRDYSARFGRSLLQRLLDLPGRSGRRHGKDDGKPR